MFPVHDEISDNDYTLQYLRLIAPDVPVVLFLTEAWIKIQGCVVLRDEGSAVETHKSEKVTVCIPIQKNGSHSFLRHVEHRDGFVQDS